MLELLSAVLLGPMEEQQPGIHGVLGRFPTVRQWPSITQFSNLMNILECEFKEEGIKYWISGNLTMLRGMKTAWQSLSRWLL